MSEWELCKLHQSINFFLTGVLLSAYAHLLTYKL